MDKHRYFVLYKPRNMVSQFIGKDQVPLLQELGFDFPEGIHAIGRLDKDSEGLLLLTTNKKVTRLLFEDTVPHKRDYLVMVKNKVMGPALLQLQQGVIFKTFDGADHHTGKCAVSVVSDPEAQFGIRDEWRSDIPHSWLHISLTEGKYHQVRKMVAAVHHRCRRLIRVAIENITVADMIPGQVLELGEQEFFEGLKIRYPR